ncbi:TPA: hypothetical protein QIR73_002103 [Enterobacter cloacae]|nr:hypothetical protein [Enterobacter cloacae]
MAKSPLSTRINVSDLTAKGSLVQAAIEDNGKLFTFEISDGVLTVTLTEKSALEPAYKPAPPDLKKLEKNIAEKPTFGDRMNQTRLRTFKK